MRKEYKKVTIQVSPEKWNFLEGYAEEIGCSRSAVFRGLLNKMIRDVEKERKREDS